MSAGHAEVAPSSAARVVQCSGSLTMEQRFPEMEDSEAAAEGAAAHWVLEQAIGGHMPSEGTLAPNGRSVTPEMQQGADVAVEQIQADLAPFGLGLADVAVEVPVTIRRVHDKCWGTPDIRCWVPADRHPQRIPTLYLWDYKFGHGVVEVFENFQLIAYATGALDATRFTDLEAQVVLGIIQPRAYHRDGVCRWWKTSFAALRPLVNIYSNAAHEALGASPRCNTGPECRDCKARHACEAKQRAAYTGVEFSSAAQPLQLDGAALGLELTTLTAAAERLKARITGLQEQASLDLKQGKRVPGWAIAIGQGRVVWTKPAEQVLAVANAMGVKVSKPVELITPKQAEAAGLMPQVIAGFSARLNGESKLTRDDGSRARKVFGQ